MSIGSCGKRGYYNNYLSLSEQLKEDDFEHQLPCYSSLLQHRSVALGLVCQMNPNIDSDGIRKIANQFDGLLTLFQMYLPNVDPDLLYDLLTRLRENSSISQAYTIEVYTRQQVDSTKVIDYIYKITGATAMVYDNDTHYVLNQKLTLNMLKEISDMDFVIEITGAPTTLGCWFSDSIKRRNI